MNTSKMSVGSASETPIFFCILQRTSVTVTHESQLEIMDTHKFESTRSLIISFLAVGVGFRAFNIFCLARLQFSPKKTNDYCDALK